MAGDGMRWVLRSLPTQTMILWLLWCVCMWVFKDYSEFYQVIGVSGCEIREHSHRKYSLLHHSFGRLNIPRNSSTNWRWFNGRNWKDEVSWWMLFLTTELLALLFSEKKLGSCKCLEPSEFKSSHLVNSDSTEGITNRNLMPTDLMRWLPGKRPDTFLNPDHPHYFVHDQSQTEPRKQTNAPKKEESCCGCFQWGCQPGHS